MRAGAFAVIFDERGRVLLCHRRDMDAWNLPGGRVEAGEAPWDAALREVREEVGVEANVIRLIGLYWKPNTDELVFSFECGLLSGTPAPSDEADRVGYFGIDELPENTVPKQVERIGDALTSQAPALKTQRGPSTSEMLLARARLR